MGDIQPHYVEPNASALGGSPDPFAKKVCKRVKEALKAKDLMQELFSDAYDYGFPTRPNYDFINQGEVRTDMIFDDTLVTAIPEFASELQSGLIPNQGEIVKLMVGPSVPEESKPLIQGQLDAITDFIHAKLRSSNMAEEVHEALQDIAVSTANIMMDAVGTLGDLNFTAIPLHEALLDVGADGKPDGKYKVHKVKNKHLKAKFPNITVSEKLAKAIKESPDVEVEVIEGIWRNWDAKNIIEHEYFVVLKAGEELLFKSKERGKGSNPWITARWSSTAGEIWGRGLVMNIMPTVKSLNLVLQLIFENAQVAIGGIWQYDSDGTINPDTIFLEPGTFIPRAPGSRIDPLESPTRFDVAQFVINDAREAIRKGMLVDALDQEGKTPPSALQVGQEIGKFARRMGASYSRLMNELVFEIFHRAVWIYHVRGIIELPEIDGELVEIMAVSPLAIAQNSQDITDFTRFIEVSNFALGPEATQMAVKPIETLEWLADKVGTDKSLIKSGAQIAQEMQQMAQAAQENPELAQQVTDATK
jgi:hypothetical protein